LTFHGAFHFRRLAFSLLLSSIFPPTAAWDDDSGISSAFNQVKISTFIFSPTSSQTLLLHHPVEIIMIGSRTALRAARTARIPARNARRFASTTQQATVAGGSSGLVGGLAGGAIVFGVSASFFPKAKLTFSS
jgi:hypothetical protein